MALVAENRHRVPIAQGVGGRCTARAARSSGVWATAVIWDRRVCGVHSARSSEMTRHFPPPWRAEKFSGGYVVRDANGFAVANVYGRSTEVAAIEAKQMKNEETRTVASKHCRPPGMLKRGE